MEWTPYLAGIGIGILSWIAFLLSDKPLGCSTAFSNTSGMIERLFRGKKTEDKEYYQKYKLGIDWQWMLVLGIIVAVFITSIITGGFTIEWVPDTFAEKFGYNPLLRWVFAIVGGILMGLGARWAGGCTSGHGISGALQLAISSWIAVIMFFIAGIITAMLIYGVL